MALTKADLIRSVVESTRFRKKKQKGQQYLFPEMNFERMPNKRVDRIVVSLFEVIKNRLEMGDSVSITGFGKWQVRFKWARKGRNPNTGETIIIDSRKVVTFRSSLKLREKINRDEKQ